MHGASDVWCRDVACTRTRTIDVNGDHQRRRVVAALLSFHKLQLEQQDDESSSNKCVPEDAKFGVGDLLSKLSGS